MGPDKEAERRQIASGFGKTLNRHGYSFQYRVLTQVKRLFEEGDSRWMYVVPEFPVVANDKGTRVDLVLEHRAWTGPGTFYMVAECKRANPALSNWCFAKAPIGTPVGQRSMHLAKHPFVESAEYHGGNVLTDVGPLGISSAIYHVGLETKSETKGDSGGSGRGAIEEAATQVCRGLNGMISFFQQNPQFFGKPPIMTFLPVIFTTARLWASDIDLSVADLEKGTIHTPDVELEEKSWLFYHYFQSPDLKHRIKLRDWSRTLGDALYVEYVRTIAIVSARGINSFLQTDLTL